MNTLLLFLVPPFVGALIGYSTNVLAIKMLFRPYREIRFFGVKLPFTPGILPKQRGKLAQNIGGMVERELITPDILRRRLTSDYIREKILNAISLFTERFLEKRPDELIGGYEDILAARITGALDRMYPVFTGSLFTYLERKEIRRELELKGQVLLRNVILKLNVFQRLFISAAQYDLTLEQKMPEIIDDLIGTAQNFLQEIRIRNMLTGSVSESIGKVLGVQGTSGGNINGKKLNELLSLSKDDKKKLDEFLFQKLISAADGHIENILSSINIKALVQERIDSLDVKKVEWLVLGVMSEQLKWVEIFGGIIGFFIGLFQAVFTFLLR